MKNFEMLTVTLFLGLLFAGSLLFWCIPDNTFSAQENRSLQQLPKPSVQALLSGKLASEMNLYFADQFPFRDELVGVKGLLEIASGKGENNGILLGEDGQLARVRFSVLTGDGEVIENCDFYDPAHVQNACSGICRAAENLNVPFSVLLTGRNIDIAPDAFDYPSDVSDALLEQIQSHLASCVTAVSTVPLLREKHADGETVYYKTDHHWTTQGA